MGLSEAIDITGTQRGTILALLERLLPNTEVWAYGSRVKWTSRPQSDLDLVVFTTQEQQRQIDALREAFEESDLPFRVDLFVWDEVPKSFRKQIHADHVALVGGHERSSTLARTFGRMVNEWTRRRLVNLCDITRGASPRPIHDWIATSGIPWVKIADATATASRYIEQTREHIRCEGRSRSVTVFPGDLILSNSASPGIPKFMNIEACIHDGWLLLRNFRGLDRLFTYYLLLHERDALVGKGTGSVFTNLKTETLKQHAVTVPKVAEQRAIARVLGTLDDKIELNRRMNQTLEAMARALFKSWFVDFDPVRAKMEGRDTGLPKNIADLFPNQLVDSELGPIPQGWDVRTLEECFNLTMGQSPPGRTYNKDSEGLPFFQGRSDFGFRYPENRKFCTAPTRIAHTGDTLVSVRAPVGDINMTWERCCIGRGVAALRHKSGSMSFSYYCTWRVQTVLREYEHTGTVFGAINKCQFEALRMVEPDPNVVAAFDAYARPLDDRIRSSTAESRTLAALCGTLLPKLMSGAMRVEKSDWQGD
jgi:type I restriction enzyme S subunit